MCLLFSFSFSFSFYKPNATYTQGHFGIIIEIENPSRILKRQQVYVADVSSFSSLFLFLSFFFSFSLSFYKPNASTTSTQGRFCIIIKIENLPRIHQTKRQ
jgi:hypothetical protein